MHAPTQRENFNHKLKGLIKFWQITTSSDFKAIPTHSRFLLLCSLLYQMSPEKHIEIFDEYMLSGIDNGYFPDNHSKDCKEFFAPLISLWHDVSGIPKEKLPLCEDILILSEAISRCSHETQVFIYTYYNLTGKEEIFSTASPIVLQYQKHRRHYKERQNIQNQYTLAQRRWQKIPKWVSASVKERYPYS